MKTRVDYPVIKRGRLSLPEPDPYGRTVISVGKVGEGSFAKAYVTLESDEREPHVYVKVKEEGIDYSKRLMAELYQSGFRSPYLPASVALGCDDEGYCFYRMPLYRAPLRKADGDQAWKDYKLLLRALGTSTRKSRGLPMPWSYYLRGYQTSYGAVEELRALGASPELIEALDTLVAASVDYGDDYALEFSPRNLATDSTGHLILLDVLFSLRGLKAVRGR